MDRVTAIESWPGRLDASGRILIPTESRQLMGWKHGTELVIESDGDSLRILSLDQFTKEVQTAFSGLPQEDHPAIAPAQYD